MSYNSGEQGGAERLVLRHKAISTKTIKIHLYIFSSLYEYVVDEEIVTANPVLLVRRRYSRSYKDNGPVHERLLISVEDMAKLIGGTLDIRNKAIIALLAKPALGGMSLYAWMPPT